MTTETKQTPTIPHYRILGTSGMRVHPLCLGTMSFGEAPPIAKERFGIGSDQEEVEKMWVKYLELGGNFIDTANMYTGGNSEKAIGTFMKKYNNVASRNELVIATKYTGPSGKGPNGAGNHKKSMVQALEASLERLQTNFVDLFYVHFWESSTPIDQIMRALDDLVRSGKVLHIAISDTPAWEVATANTFASFHGWSPFVAYQGRYSLVDRGIDNDVLPMCRKHGLGLVPWGVVGQGKLTGKITRENQGKTTETGETQRKLAPMTEEEFKVQDAVLKIAKEVGRTPSQVAINWVLQQEGVASALIGPRTYEQFVDNMGAVDFKLTKEQVGVLSEASKNTPALIFPHNFLGGNYKTMPWLQFGEKKFVLE